MSHIKNMVYFLYFKVFNGVLSIALLKNWCIRDEIKNGTIFFNKVVGSYPHLQQS